MRNLTLPKQYPVYNITSLRTYTTTTAAAPAATIGTFSKTTKDPFIVLGIETSCDDTSAAVVRSDPLVQAQVTVDQLDAIAVTRGPGLPPCLPVGLNAAKTLAAVHGNH
ncbi:unnamed protein product [Absidia cylindrospora]